MNGIKLKTKKTLTNLRIHWNVKKNKTLSRALFHILAGVKPDSGLLQGSVSPHQCRSAT